MTEQNLTMLCDFYELTMGNGYFQAGMRDRVTYFDVFFGQCRRGRRSFPGSRW